MTPETRAQVYGMVESVFQSPPAELIAVVRERMAALTDEDIICGPIMSFILTMKVLQGLDEHGLPAYENLRGMVDQLVIPADVQFMEAELRQLICLGMGSDAQYHLALTEYLRPRNFQPPTFIFEGQKSPMP